MTTTEEVIRFAKDRGMYVHDLQHLARLIELVKAEENEACAKACDELAYQWRGANSRIVDCAEAIRARRNHG